MYDRKTQSLWQSFTGEPVIGRLAYSGLRLRLIPISVTTWADWLAEHPDTTVLSDQTGFRFTYEKPGTPGSQYFEYYASPDVMFPAYVQSTSLPPKSDVLGLEIGGNAKAYPVAVLARQRVVNDVLGGTGIVIAADSEGRDAKAYLAQGHVFLQGAKDREIVDEAGEAWLVADDALVMRGDSSVTLERISGYVAFWFGWYASRPHTEVYEPTGGG